MSKKYLLIGAIPTDKPKSYGGTTILVKQLIDYFDEEKIDYVFIQTNRYEGKFSVFKNYMYTILNFFKYVKSIDIVFTNVASNGMYFLSPLLLLLSKKYNKKFISRSFGGDSIKLFEDVGYLKKVLISYLFKEADILFFETKYLVEYFKNMNSHTYWFPNTRKEPKIKRDISKEYKKKFIFLGHIKQEKGIDEILSVSKLLDDSYHIQLYGSIIDNKYGDKVWNKYKNISYNGVSKPSEIHSVLSKCDVLLLPTYWKGEGYPGVIIEALSVGLPVIASKLPSIHEIVDEKCGRLISVKDSDNLLNAIKSITKKNFSFLSYNALKKFENFKYENVYRNVIKICEDMK